MALAEYLAKNYLNVSEPANGSSDLNTRPPKKRKKDKSSSDAGLIIADDDDLLLSNKSKDLDEYDQPVFDSSTRSAEFRKTKKNNWKPLNPRRPDNDTGQADADRILSKAAVENAKARAEIDNEDAPAVVKTIQDDGPRMTNGARAGLQTAEDIARLNAELQKREELDKRALKKAKREGKEDASGEETVYRDATGRRIDVSMKRAEARAAELEKLRLEKKEKEDAMGDVQKKLKEQKKQELEDAKFLTVARGVDDEDMNEGLKNQLRWDDPMAQYMAEKRREEVRPVNKAASKGNSGQPQRKVYAGAAPPNRYGILPGWRWDGVDRGTGFEREWFQARGKKSRNENLEYQWQLDE